MYKTERLGELQKAGQSRPKPTASSWPAPALRAQDKCGTYSDSEFSKAFQGRAFTLGLILLALWPPKG